MGISERNSQLPAGQTFGKSGVLYLLATSSEPLTVVELAEDAPVSRNAVDGAIKGLYRDGYVVRRRRELERLGADPYEYAIRDRGDAVDDGTRPDADSGVADGE